MLQPHLPACSVPRASRCWPLLALLLIGTAGTAAAQGPQPGGHGPPADDEKRAYGSHEGFSYGGKDGDPVRTRQREVVDLEAAPRVRWIGSGDGAWSDPSNWSGGGVPGRDDHAIIDAGGAYTVTLDAEAIIAGLTLGGADASPTLRLPRHSLVVRGPGRVAGGAVFHLDGGILTGDGDLEVAGLLRWTGGTMSGLGRTAVAPGGRLVIAGASRKFLSVRALDNRGELRWRGGGSLVLTFATPVRNLAGGSFVVEADAVMDVYRPPGPTFENAGRFRVDSGGELIMEAPFHNAGSVEIGPGALHALAGYRQVAGSVVLADGRLSSEEPVRLEGGLLRGDGVIDADLVNGGVVEPGGATGRLRIEGDYGQSAEGLVRVELGNGDPIRMEISGRADLGGTLEVRWNGQAPEAGDGVQVLAFGSASGRFAELQETGRAGESTLQATVREHVIEVR